MIKIASISDCHIKTFQDDASILFKSFASHPELIESTHIIFLGDIFDNFAGSHREYIVFYSEFFDIVTEFIRKNKMVIFIEGNHDFHIQELFDIYFDEHNLDKSLFKYIKNSFQIKIGSYNVNAIHGDQLDYNNKAYKRWKKIYTSIAFKFFINKILNFKALQKIGNWASSDSKNRNRKTFVYDQARDKYRQGAVLLLKDLNKTILLAGHTHISDQYDIDSNIYINSGFPLNDKKFVVIDSDGPRFVNLI